MEDKVNGYIVAKTEIKERLTAQVVSRMFEVDFAKREYGVALSREDRQFLKIVEDGIYHRDDMHYEMPLPFREKNVQLPNNRPQAEQRLHGLKKLQGDGKYRADNVNNREGICSIGQGWRATPSRRKGLVPISPRGLPPPKTRQHTCSFWWFSLLPGLIAQWPPIARARSNKQAHWGGYKIQRGEGSLHGWHTENVFQVKVSKGRSELPSLLMVAKWRFNSRPSRVLRDIAPLWSWFNSRVF